MTGELEVARMNRERDIEFNLRDTMEEKYYWLPDLLAKKPSQKTTPRQFYISARHNYEDLKDIILVDHITIKMYFFNDHDFYYEGKFLY